MKQRILILLLAALFLTVSKGYAEDKKTSLPVMGSGHGGMTYSPTEGWIKTGANQMRVGTDTMEITNLKKAAEDEKKRLEQKAEMENAAKLKAEEDAKSAEQKALEKEKAARSNNLAQLKRNSGKKDGKKPAKARVLVS